MDLQPSDPRRQRPPSSSANPSANPSRRRVLATVAGLAATPLAAMLAGCGGNGDSSSSGPARLRAINVMSDVASADLYFDDVRILSALGASATSATVELDPKDYVAKIKRAGESATLSSGTYSMVTGGHYTAVLWGRESYPRLTTLPEDETDTDIDVGNTRLRVLGATQDSGSLDIYLTAEDTALADATPRVASITSGQLSGFAVFAAGTWRLRITGAGDVNDLRLDVSGVVLASQKHHTLVLTPSGGGVLVDALLLPQQATETVLRNTQARVRVVASSDSAGVVAVSRGGRTLAAALRSPSVGPYQMVEAGALPFTVRLNGVEVASEAPALTAGGDFTLLVDGSGQAHLLTDDNRLPSNSARLKIRLVHGVAGLDPLTLSINYLALLDDVPQGSASGYVVTTASSAAQLDVTAASALLPIYTNDAATLAANSVYTVFVLGGNVGGPTGVIRKER